MDPKLQFACYVAAAVCFGLSALGGFRRGTVGPPVMLVPLGLLFWLLPLLWTTGDTAF
jgi:hypothetical protein